MRLPVAFTYPEPASWHLPGQRPSIRPFFCSATRRPATVCTLGGARSHEGATSTVGVDASKIKTRKSRGYWKSMQNITNELQAFIASRPDSPKDVIPDTTEFTKANRTDLLGAIVRYPGSWDAVCDAMGLKNNAERERRTKGDGSGGLASGKDAEAELFCEQVLAFRNAMYAYMEEKRREFDLPPQTHPVESLAFPTVSELRCDNRNDLVEYAEKLGGYSEVIEKLKIRKQYFSRSFWSQFDNVEALIRQFMDAFHFKNFPTVKYLKWLGPPGIVAMMDQYGGFAVVASRMNLSVQRRPRK